MTRRARDFAARLRGTAERAADELERAGDTLEAVGRIRARFSRAARVLNPAEDDGTIETREVAPGVFAVEQRPRSVPELLRKLAHEIREPRELEGDDEDDEELEDDDELDGDDDDDIPEAVDAD